MLLFLCPARAEELPTINILAPSSLSELVSDLAREYSSIANVSVIASFGTSREHLAAITEGNPADVIITYDPEMVRAAKNQGLMDVYSLSSLFKDYLVVLSPKDRSKLHSIMEAQSGDGSNDNLAGVLKPVGMGDVDITTDVLNFVNVAHRHNMIRTYADVRKLLLHRPIIIGDPETTKIGVLSLQLAKALLLPEIKGDGVSHARNARAILMELVDRQAVAIALKSDAVNMGFASDNSVYQIDEVDQKLYSPIIFQAFVAASTDMEKPRALLAFMKSPSASRIISRYGFEAIEQQP